MMLIFLCIIFHSVRMWFEYENSFISKWYENEHVDISSDETMNQFTTK